MKAVFILELVEDLLTGFGEHHKMSFIEIVSISRKGHLLGPCSGAVLDGGKWVPECSFVHRREQTSLQLYIEIKYC
jgi:hypothetical protein